MVRSLRAGSPSTRPFEEYLHDPQLTREAMHDGPYHTGKMWHGADEDGYFWFVGRIDDVIKSSATV